MERGRDRFLYYFELIKRLGIIVLMTLLFLIAFIIDWRFGVSLVAILFWSMMFKDYLLSPLLQHDDTEKEDTIKTEKEDEKKDGIIQEKTGREDSLKADLLHPEGQGEEVKQDSKGFVWKNSPAQRNSPFG